MFLTKKFHREILAAQKAESDRVIIALSEQVEYLRQLLGRPLIAPQKPSEAGGAPLRMVSERPYMSEIEEEIHWHQREGTLDPEQAKEALKEFGLGIDPGPELDID